MRRPDQREQLVILGPALGEERVELGFGEVAGIHAPQCTDGHKSESITLSEDSSRLANLIGGMIPANGGDHGT